MSNNIKNNGDLLEAKRKKKQDIIIIIVGLVVGIIISLGIIANRETSYSIKTKVDTDTEEYYLYLSKKDIQLTIKLY